MSNARRPFAELPPAQQAGILCNDPRFQAFAATRCDIPADRITASATAEFLRQTCGIKSRAYLNTNQDAKPRFAALLTEFDAWRGKIAKQPEGRTTQ